MGNKPVVGHEVSTNLLVDSTPLDMWVPVLIGPKKYVMKRARDLVPRNRVGVNKEGSEKTLEELEPLMELFSDYVETRDVVFCMTGDGKQTPRFKIELIRGIAEKLEIDLESRLLERENPLEGDEFDRMVDYLVGREVPEPTARRWLNGEVVIPYRRNLELIREDIPVAEHLSDELETRGGVISSAYKYWKVSRQQLMKELGRLRRLGEGVSVEGGEAREDEPSINVSDMEVVKGVVELLEKEGELSRNLSFAWVRRTRPLRRDIREPSGIVYRGLARDIPPELGFEETSMNRIYHDHLVVTDAFHDVLHKEAIRRTSERGPVLTESFTGTLMWTFMAEKHLSYLDPYIAEALEVLREGGEDLFNNLESLADSIYRGIHDGEVDIIYGVEEGTAKKLFEAYDTLRRALPHLYFVYLRDSNIKARIETGAQEGSPKDVKALDKRLVKTRKELIEVYDIDMNTRMVPTIYVKSQTALVYSRSMEVLRENPLEMARLYKKTGIELMTIEEVKDIFERNGVPRGVEFIDSANTPIMYFYHKL